jgi:phosphopantothenoylcysteine decarboxylase/phosphopantothenate--cysteine ligase
MPDNPLLENTVPASAPAKNSAEGAPKGSQAPAEVVLGVGGGIAAYKVATLLRLFTESGATVQVVPTPAALRFVGSATWEALSGRAVHTEVWDDVAGVGHVSIGRAARLLVVAPATADLLARAAAGRADDLLTATLLTARCPVLMVPAMHTEMWTHPATVANVATLRSRGVVVLEPAVGRLTGTDSGPGRMPEPEAILAVARAMSHTGGQPDMAGLRVLVSAGGTREPVDPVRYLGNRSTGIQGYALAATAAARGATVTVVAANVELPVPAGVAVRRVGTARQMRDAVLSEAQSADVVVMAAAVADFRPAVEVANKIKKEDSGDSAPEPIALLRNPDILAELVAVRRAGGLPADMVIVGFAAETGDPDHSPIDHARLKLARKGADLLVLNDVSGGRVFGQPDNEVRILAANGPDVGPVRGSKGSVAHAVWDRVLQARVDKA